VELTYEQRIEAQIAQYAETVNMHDLPDIFHVWSHNYIGPPMAEVFGTPSIDEAYALAYIEAREGKPGLGKILSIGCGDGQVEIRVAKILIEKGHRDFLFVCADLSPILLGHLRTAVKNEGLENLFLPIEADLNRIKVEGSFDMIMANHALHHIEALEQLFDYSRIKLTERGIFATCDMIGRNGHRRWIECDVFIQSIWPMLSPKQQYHVQLKRHSETFVDHDCSREGFEGIRAEDILPLLMKTFNPYKFVGAGGLIDVFVDRGYGHGFNPKDEKDLAMIHHIAGLNEILLDAGAIKPVWTMAYFTKDRRQERFYRNRSAANSLRNPNIDPVWTKHYKESPYSGGMPEPVRLIKGGQRAST
jgi:SAM-dependent methyltransferase